MLCSCEERQLIPAIILNQALMDSTVRLAPMDVQTDNELEISDLESLTAAFAGLGQHHDL